MQVDLVHNGSNLAVTNENKMNYIYKVADYRLNRQLVSLGPCCRSAHPRAHCTMLCQEASCTFNTTVKQS